MLIQCPRCSTGWRVAEVSPVDNPIFKCGRCHHIFRQFPGAPSPGARRASAEKRAGRRPADDNLEFIFPDTAPEDAAACDPPPDDVAAPRAAKAAPDDDLVLADEDEDVTLDALDDAGDTALHPDEADDDEDAPHELDPADDADDLALHRDFDDPDDDEAAHELDGAADLTHAPRWSADRDAPAANDASRVLHVEDIMPRSYGFRAIVRPLAVIVALHAALAVTIRIAPERAGAWLSRIPIAGTLLSSEPTLARRVELRNVVGRFQQLRNARRVFVISGEAVNHAEAAIDRIEVQGTLYGTGGQIERKVVNAGNRTTLTDLSESEIALLQRLDPRAIIGPGESSTFSIVFLEPPREVREFSSRVLNVRRTRRLATDPTLSDPRRGPVG